MRFHLRTLLIEVGAACVCLAVAGYAIRALLLPERESAHWLAQGMDVDRHEDGSVTLLLDENATGSLGAIPRTEVIRHKLANVIYWKSVSGLAFDRCSVGDQDLRTIPLKNRVASLAFSEVRTLDCLDELERCQSVERLLIHNTRFNCTQGLGISKLRNLRIVEASLLQDGDLICEAVSVLKGLEVFKLEQSTVSTTGIANVVKCDSLKEVNLRYSGLTVDGFKHLEKLKRLESLSARGMQWSDELIPVLVQMSALRKIDLHDSGIGLETVEELQNMRPELEIRL